MQLFVYGTLTDRARADRVLGPDGYSFVGRATLEGLRRADGEYPTLVPGDRVRGRLLETDERGVDRLDRYEGVDRGLYVRVPIERADGGTAWTYVGDPDRLGIEGASWPSDGSFDSHVRSYCSRSEVVVRGCE